MAAAKIKSQSSQFQRYHLTAPANTSEHSFDSTLTELKVQGMTCENRTRNVREAIQGLPGVDSVTVVLENAEAVVKWKGENASRNKLGAIPHSRPPQAIRRPTRR